ncbi:MAG: nucleotidyltransferase family protein [Actinomycetota bacterium]
MTEGFDPDVIVGRIAAFGLPNGDPFPAPIDIAKEEWQKVLPRLHRHHITGFAVAAAEAGSLALSAEQTDALLETHREAMLAPLAVERGLLEVATELHAGDVEFVVLKGPALAHTVYPNPSWRYFGDLDLLVRGGDWPKACTILESLGYRRGLPEPRGGFDQRFGKASEFRRQGGIEVDLHRTLVVGPFGLWIEPDILFEATTELLLWDQTHRRLDDTLLQLHACVHASLGWWPPLMMPVRDVAQVAHCAQVDWEALADRAARWKLRAVVRHALQTASETLEVGLPAGADKLVAYTPSRKEHRALQGYVTDRRKRGGTAVATLKAIPGLTAKVAFLRALIFPNREFLAARSGSARSYWRRWAIPVRWVLRRRRRT